MIGMVSACAGGQNFSGQSPSNLSAAPTPLKTSRIPPSGAQGAPVLAGSLVHVALLAPLTGAEADVGASLVNAAQLALAAPGSPVLDVRDTQSTQAGAAAAASAALAAGDQMIIGPLSAMETAAVTPIATKAGVPVLAFTNDPSAAAPGVWTLGISPGAQVRRLVFAAHNDNRTKLAALLPQSPYGDLVATALTQAAAEAGFPAPQIMRYGSSFASMNATVRQLADYNDRRAPLDAQIRHARAKRDAEGRKEAADLAKQPIPPPPFDVLMVGAVGQQLSELESLLPYYDITPGQVRFLGPNGWAYAQGLGLSAITGGWFAAPDPALRTQFQQSYAAKYAVQPPAIADVAFDAGSLARLLVTGAGISTDNLQNPSGFAGVDGVFALQPDGHVKRALAVFQMEATHANRDAPPQMVQPSPQNLAVSGS